MPGVGYFILPNNQWVKQANIFNDRTERFTIASLLDNNLE
jgi:hypothetical protein